MNKLTGSFRVKRKMEKIASFQRKSGDLADDDDVEVVEVLEVVPSDDDDDY